MLGRGVARVLALDPGAALFSSDVVEAVQEADLFLLNLECCISGRGTPGPDPRKPFFFRAPPTVRHLRAAGIAWVGAGADREEAQAAATFQRNGFRLGVTGRRTSSTASSVGPSTTWATLSTTTPPTCPDATTSGSCSS
jgi:hypothetical protein